MDSAEFSYHYKFGSVVKMLLIYVTFCVFVLFQFQTELRKILVSLIEVAQKLLALNPDAVELFKKANGKAYNPSKLFQSQES